MDAGPGAKTDHDPDAGEPGFAHPPLMATMATRERAAWVSAMTTLATAMRSSCDGRMNAMLKNEVVQIDKEPTFKPEFWGGENSCVMAALENESMILRRKCWPTVASFRLLLTRIEQLPQRTQQAEALRKQLSENGLAELKEVWEEWALSIVHMLLAKALAQPLEPQGSRQGVIQAATEKGLLIVTNPAHILLPSYMSLALKCQ